MTQASVLHDFTASNTIYQTTDLADQEIWEAKLQRPEYTVLTVSRKAAARVNNIVVQHAFQNSNPLTDIPLAGELDTLMYPFKELKVIITKNLDKATGVVNGQVATVIGNEGRTLLLEFPNKQRTFTTLSLASKTTRP